MKDPIWILEGARTPFAAWSAGTRGDGQKGGALKGLDPFDLAAISLKASLEKAGLAAGDLELLVFGNMYHAGPHACYGGRYAAHRAGLPDGVPSVTCALACGTGLYALKTAAESIALGQGRIVACAGADSPSLVRRDVFVPSFQDVSCGLHIAQTAQELAREMGIGRDEQDGCAMESHRRAFAARGRGILAEEIAPAAGCSEDDAILADPRPEIFARSKPLIEDSQATAANTHAIVDGGSALLLGCGKLETLARPPLGRYLGAAVVSLPARKMPLGSVEAIRSLLGQTSLKLSDFDLFEINETFAAQLLVDLKLLGLSGERVNVNGGALALGHPFAGTGARLVLTLLRELGRRDLRRGIASICVGGGLGIAVAVESAKA